MPVLAGNPPFSQDPWSLAHDGEAHPPTLAAQPLDVQPTRPSLVRSESALLLVGQGPGPWTESRHLILPLAEDLPEAAGFVKASLVCVSEIR